jgi:ATP-dependent Lon protease
MELIRLDGYTEHEKLAIAERYLVRKQSEAHGLSTDTIALSSKAILEIIRHYTREAGVRNLEREIARISRKAAHRLVTGRRKSFSVQPKNLKDFLGPRRYNYGMAEEKDSVGVATGLAWTEVGGDLLTIEVAIVPGKGKLTVTGKLGDVMQESAQAAMTYVRSRWQLLGLERDFYQNLDIHIHVPEGAIPKDGPSAGITMATALISALTERMVRREIAMTGEITLRGNVLAIGGLKEKLLAARRGGISLVVIPQENEKDLSEIPQEVYAGMVIKPVGHMDEVTALAITGGAVSIPSSGLHKTQEAASDTVTAH